MPSDASAGLEKLITLSLLTLRVLVHGVLGREAFDSLTGNWGFPVQFRRPLMAILQNCYSWGSKLSSNASKIPHNVCQEFFMLLVLFNHCCTNLSSGVCKTVAATDASPTGLGCCEVKVGSALAHRIFHSASMKGERVGDRKSVV